LISNYLRMNYLNPPSVFPSVRLFVQEMGSELAGHFPQFD